MTTIVSELLRDSLGFYAYKLSEYLSESGAYNLVAAATLDHIAIKLRNLEEFNDIGHSLPDWDRVYTTKLDGRTIWVRKLVSPVLLGPFGETDLLEIIEPKHKKLYKDFVGLEHVEFYHPDFSFVWDSLQKIGLNFKEAKNTGHSTLVMQIDGSGREVKFTDKKLSHVLEEQVSNNRTALGVKVECADCRGSGRKWVVDRVVQGQSYGPEEDGHYEQCLTCHGTGKTISLKRV